MRRPLGAAAALSSALAVLVAVVGLVTSAGPAPAQPVQDDAAPRRLLVISVPGLTWADVEDEQLLAIERLVSDGALADLAPRSVSPRSTPGDAYLTMSAGTRATTERSIDGQVLGLQEQSSGSAAGEIFTRRTGLVPDGEFVSLSWPSLLRENARKPYDAELGLLAETLRAAGVSVSAIGNADGADAIGPSYQRQVGLSMADADGVVAAGALEDDLLADDVSRPFGVRLDHDQVVAAVAETWARGERQVTVVEASDLARALRYRPIVDEDRYREIWAESLHDADTLVQRLLESVDLERDVVLLVAPYNLARDRDLTTVALAGAGVDRGYLESASTQRAGFLTLVDIGPTILDRLGVERPTEMEGRPAEVSLSSASLDARIDHLVTLNAASRFRERLLVPTTTVAVVGLALLTAAAVVLHARGGRTRWRGVVVFGTLADLSLLPASYLARGFALEERGIGFYWAFLVGAAVATSAIATVAARLVRRPLLALVAVLALVALVLVVDVMTGSTLSLSAAFGYSATGNSRLYGISNYSFGQLAVAACLLAAFVASRSATAAHRLGAVGLLLATLIVLGVPAWGSDVGGVLAFTPAIGLFALVLWGWRLRARAVVLAVVGTAVAITTFGLIDLSRPAEDRAHLGRLFERVGDEGLEPLVSIMERKLVANLGVSTSSLWVAAIPIAVAFGVYLATSARGSMAQMQRTLPALRAGLAASVAAAVLGSLVNDSGAIVGGVASMVLTASLVVLLLTPAGDEGSAV